MEVKVKDCEDCPLKKHHRGHGENWDYCDHPRAPSGYGGILDKYNPDWCPLKKAKYIVELEKKEND